MRPHSPPSLKRLSSQRPPRYLFGMKRYMFRAMADRLGTSLLIAFAFLLCGNRASCAATANYEVFVTDERSGEITVIDGGNDKVIATFPVGKRPRGIQVSPDHKTI